MISQIMRAFTVLQCALFIASASATSTTAATVPCPRPCECFTTDHGIQAANCTDLPDQMTTAWPQKVLRIRFEPGRNREPIMLKNKAFKHFPGLTYLEITNGPVRYVGNSAFDGLPELVELNLVGTGIRKLHRNTFANNRKLAFVSLKKNPGLLVSPSFIVSESVTELDLSACGLTALRSGYFKGLPNLKYLLATDNELKSLGPQFGPPGIKYVNLARNRIENVYENLETYKRLRTVDLTGNPVNCSCELSDVDRVLAARGVAFGNTIVCGNTGKPLGDMTEECSDQEMMGDDPAMDMYAKEDLLKTDQSAVGPRSAEDNEDNVWGSGSGDGELTDFATVTTDKSTTAIPVSEEVIIKTHAEDALSSRTSSTQHPEIEIVGTSPEPSTTSEPSVTSSEAPGAVQESVVSSVSSEAPIVSSEAPTVSSETSSVTSEAPVISSEAPVISSESPVVSSEIPSVSSEAPSVSSEAPTEVVVSTVASSTTTDETTTFAGGPAVPVPIDGETGPSSTAHPGEDQDGIVPHGIQAPEDHRQDDEAVQAKVVEYLKSNYGITATAIVLAVVIVAIVYKAVCIGKSRSRRNTAADGKNVELKEVKYAMADTEDRLDDGDDESPSGSAVNDNLLLDGNRGDSDDDGDDDDDEDEAASSSPSPAPVTNGRGPRNNGGELLNSVMDAVAKGQQAPTTGSSPPVDNNGSTVPTRVIVKLCETPKASKPITINNVH